MEDIFTCICGGQSWTIYDPLEISCRACDIHYTLKESTDAIDFNDDPAEFTTNEQAECIDESLTTKMCIT